MANCNVRALEVVTTGWPELMSLVYRIQSKQDRTRGAYRPHIFGELNPEVVSRLHEEHGYGNDGKHPSPHEDIDISRDGKSGEHSGCATAADLLRWFKGFIPDLLRAGYEIVALRDVTVTAVGEFQVLFTFNT